MREERLNFGIIVRVLISLLPILFGWNLVAMIMCAYNIAMSFIICGPLTALVSSMSAVCVSMFLHGMYGEGAKLDGLFLALEAILCAAGCIYAIFTKKGFYKGVWLSAIGFLIPSFVSLKYYASKAGLSVAQFLAEPSFSLYKEQFAEMAKQMPDNEKLLNEVADAVYQITISVIPSVLIIASLVIGYIVMWCISAQLRKIPKSGIVHSFSQIRVPKTAVVIMLLSIFLYITNMEAEIGFIFLNLFIIMFMLCAFSGISFVDFYLRKSIKSKFVRVLIYFFLNIFPLYVLIAIVDSFANFRKLTPIIIERGDSYETEKRED